MPKQLITHFQIVLPNKGWFAKKDDDQANNNKKSDNNEDMPNNLLKVTLLILLVNTFYILNCPSRSYKEKHR